MTFEQRADGSDRGADGDAVLQRLREQLELGLAGFGEGEHIHLKQLALGAPSRHLPSRAEICWRKRYQHAYGPLPSVHDAACRPRGVRIHQRPVLSEHLPWELDQPIKPSDSITQERRWVFLQDPVRVALQSAHAPTLAIVLAQVLTEGAESD